jgi:hypothetical protein
MIYGIILLKIFQACFGALVQRTELILGKTVMENIRARQMVHYHLHNPSIIEKRYLFIRLYLHTTDSLAA